MKKFLIISVFASLISLEARSQYINLSDDPTMFVEQADSLLKQWGNIGDSTADNFSAVWFDLNSEDQDKVIEISRTFRNRKYPVRPFFIVFYNALYNAVYGNYSNMGNVSDFLAVAQKVVANSENPREVLRYFVSSRNLFEHGALYYHQYNVLQVPEGGSFKFDYVEAETYLDPIISQDLEEDLNQEPQSEPVAEEQTQEEEETGDLWGDDAWGDDAWSDDSWDNDSWGEEEEKDPYASFDNNENPDNYGAGNDDFDPFGTPAPMVDLPEIFGATIKIENALFEFNTPYDTFSLDNVSGTYVFGSRNFVGDTAVMPIIIPLGEYETDAEVTFGKFAFNTINPSISAENAILSYPDLFDVDVKGSFLMRSVQPKRSGKKYPVFRSYKSNYEYKNIGEGVKLTGGFTLLGKKISTQGEDLARNYLEIYRDEELILKGNSQRFYLMDTLLKSHKVDLVVYTNEDSLRHPQMELKYDMYNSILTLYWEDSHFKERPMINSFHDVNIVADKMTWDLYTDRIDFGIIEGRSEVPAIVRSNANFDDQEYIRIKGLYNFHPVGVAAYFALKTKMMEFSYFELAEAYKINPSVMKKAIITAAGKGYLDFDEFNGLIRINEKTKHAYNSNFKKSDFDNMEWYSVSPTGQNISYLLDSGHLVIRGVDMEIVSDELNVFYKPDSGVVILRENRDFTFNGEILAGLYSIKGKKFDFSYDDFHVVLNEIDSIRFNLTNDSTGERSERKILGGEVENTGGTLYLNEPDNKSGRKHLAQYPILDVTKPSYVYFDDKDILGGVYDRRVYFEIPSFKIDTLVSDNPSVINVHGTFHSDGIIPDIETELIVNPDLTLGFTYEVPEEGFPIFGNEEARFYNVIHMNKKGLNGDGTFNYLTSTTDAKEVTFYQDSMVIRDAVVDVKAGDTEFGDYPDAKCDEAKTVLMASNERYIINSKRHRPIDMYDGEATLEGAAMISKKGMYGIGDVRTKGTDSRSSHFRFSKRGFVARDAEFFIEAYDQDTFALAANNAKLTFDFDSNTAVLQPEIEGDAVISMPLMYYKTSIPVGTWDLDEQTFTMVKPADVNIENSYFYSTLEDQDSLAFSGESAVYDAVASILTVKGVPGIYVADAYISPGDSTVIVDPSALIEPLVDARIEMDAYGRYHHLKNAMVDVYSRNKFDADATYEYVNSGFDTMEILFEGLYQVAEEEGKRNTDSVTYGEGYIPEEDSFYISPKIFFQGDVAVWANKPFLEFNGEIRLDLKHSDEFNDWLPFVYSGDPNEIRIELKDERELEENEPLLTTGIHVDGGESQMYYTLLSSKRMMEDPDIFRATGLLSIDAETGNFKVGSEEKLSGETKIGNLFSFNDSTSIIEVEGEFKIYGYMPEIVTAHSFGKGRVNVDSGNYTFNTLTYLEFPIPGQALSAMGEDMSETTQYIDDLKVASKSSYKTITKLSQMIGEKAAENYNEQLYLEYIPLHAVSGKFNKSILFADMDLYWHQKEGALYSGDSVGLSSVGKNDINGRIKGYYEVKKLYEDEIVNLYLELRPDCWYYFSYDNGKLASFSSNHVYNEIIESKAKSPESGAAPGEFYLASADLFDVVDYIKYYNETYLGKTLKDEEIALKVSKPEVEDKYAGGKKFDEGSMQGGGWGEEKPQQETGWGSEEESGWGTEEEFDDGWGAPVEEDQQFLQESPQESQPEEKPTEQVQEESQDQIETTPFGGEPEEDTGWGWGAEEDEAIVGAPPKEDKKEKRKKGRDREEKTPVVEEKPKPKEQESGWGWGSEPEESNDGWGFGSEPEEEPVIVNEKEEKPVKETKPEPKKEEKVIAKEEEKPAKKEEVDTGWGWGSEPEEEEDDGWGFGGGSESVEIVNDKEEEEKKAKEEADRKAKEDADRKAKAEAEKKAKEEADRKAKEAADKKAREEAERKAKEEAEKKVVVEEDDDLGWGFGGDDESVEIVNDKEEEEKKAKEEAEKKAKEEAERKAKEEADKKAKEEAERKAKAEAEKKAKEEAERKAKEEAERKAKEEENKKIVVEDDDDSGWGFGGDDESVEIVNDKKAEEEKKAKEEAEKKAKEEEERKKKEEAEKKAKEEAERKKKEEEEKKKKEKEKEENQLIQEEEEDDWDGF